MQKTITEKIQHAVRIDRAVQLVLKTAPGWTLLNLILQVLLGVLPLAALYLMKLIVDAVTVAVTAADKGDAFVQVMLLLLLAAGIALLISLCQLLASIASEAMSLAVTDHVFDIMHAKSVEADLEYYENPRYFDTLHRAQREGPHRPTAIVHDLVRLVHNCVSLVAMAGLLITLHWFIAAVLFVAVLPGITVRIHFSNKLYAWKRERTKTERQATYLNWVLTGDMHAKEVRLFGLGDLLIERFSRLQEKLRTEKLVLSKRQSTADFLAQAGATVAVFGSFAYIAYKTVYGHITMGDMVMFFQAFQRGLNSMKSLLGSVASLYENNLFLSHLFDFLMLRPKVKQPATPSPLPRPIHEGIQFDSISFQYPSSKRKVLENVSFTITPGETVALVGRNGSGKTTLAKLLCRLYDPMQGFITIDGIDIRQFDLLSLRKSISVLFQDFVKYHLSAGENIWFGDVGQPKDDEKIKDAAQKAGVHELIAGLPRGYETLLGKWFEDGEELSRGEWQKIALARAFYRKSQIILLDEPASSLDPQAEYDVFCRFKELARGATAIFISHRISTVKMADRVLVIDRGRIVESGTYDELMQNQGAFAHLFDTHTEKLP